MTNIHYLPFINNNDAIVWRQSLEQSFINAHQDDYNRLNAARSNGTAEDDLNDIKRELQCKWFMQLNKEIYEKLGAKLQNLPVNETVIAALPEFFWRNINDNKKHERDIANYGKSFSYEVKQIWENSKPSDEYSFQNLTAKYPNLILFAGTIWRKKDNVIRNSLPIFANGNFFGQWPKRNLSGIDGLGDNIPLSPTFDMNKVDKVTVHWTKPDFDPTDLTMPMITFNNLTIGLDICLDFIVPGSRSADLLFPTVPDIHLLIAGGMPVDNNNAANINASRLFLRCDAMEYWTNASYQNISLGGPMTAVLAPAAGELFASISLII